MRPTRPRVVRSLVRTLGCTTMVASLAAQRDASFLPSHPVQWSASPVAGGARTRAALIITADRYSEARSFDMPSAKRSGEVVRDALVQYGGFARTAIRELSGEQVHDGAIEAAIRTVAASIGDGATVKEGTLLVLWVGHGFTAGQGPAAEQQLFTHYTAPVGGGFAPTLGQRRINGWLDAAHDTAKQRGVHLAIALVVDACRPNTGEPPRGAKLVSSKSWQVSSATDGQFALGGSPTDAMVFSQAFADALRVRAAQAGSAELQQVFAEARDATLQRTQNAQRPQLVEPSDAELAKRTVAVVVPRRVGFTVKLVDALTGGRVEKGKVRLDDSLHETAGASIVLTAAPGDHQLELLADGYLTRAESLSLGDEQADREVTVPLLPSVRVVRVQVSPPRVVDLAAHCDSARAGYHVMAARTNGKGQAELRLPATPGIHLQLLHQGRELMQLPLDISPTALLRDPDGRHTGIPLIEVSASLGADALALLGPPSDGSAQDASPPDAKPDVSASQALAAKDLRVRLYHSSEGRSAQWAGELCRHFEAQGFPPVEQINLRRGNGMSDRERMSRFLDDLCLFDVDPDKTFLVLYPAAAESIVKGLRAQLSDSRIVFRVRADKSRQRTAEGDAIDRVIDWVGLPKRPARLDAPPVANDATAPRDVPQLAAADVKLRIYHRANSGNGRRILQQVNDRLQLEGFKNIEVIDLNPKIGMPDKERMARFVDDDCVFDLNPDRQWLVVYPKGAVDVVRQLKELFPDDRYRFKERSEGGKQRAKEGDGVDRVIDWVGLPRRAGK